MANWDIFHTDRLEAERSLSTEAVRAAVASGAIRADDLVRPAGSSVSWARIGDTPELLPSFGAKAPTPRPEPPKTTVRPAPAPPSTPSTPAESAKPPAARPRPSSAAPRPERPSRPETPPPPPPPPRDDSAPILDAAVVEDDEDDEVVELAEVIDDLEPVPIDLDDADANADAGPDSDFDDSIPAPPLGKAPEEERTVELPPRSAKSPRPAPPPVPPPVPVPSTPAPPPDAVADAEDDTDAEVEVELEVDSEFDIEAIPSPDLSDRHAAPIVETSSETLTSAELFGLFDPADEDEEAAAFTLAAEPRDEPEEIDLTAMVDVAFQLVLFFLVTATTLYFKTLEIPTPDPEDPDAVAQQMRTLDDLLDEYILVEIDPQGRISVDREPIDLAELTERLRQARADTLRSGMLLMADFTTPHRNAVSAIDSANALGLQIAIAKPSAPPD